MCDLTMIIPSEKQSGFKIVLENRETGKYYSLAMGFQYREGELIPHVSSQKVLCSYFREDILKGRGQGPFKLDMIGRTAIFLNESDSYKITTMIRPSHYDGNKYNLKVVKATVAEDLMKGTYKIIQDNDMPVVAGRKIYFKEKEEIK